MLPSRRFLPSMAALLAFEAMARLGTVTAAGEELGLSQGAVSRQLQNLERQLGVTLCSREKRRLRLTPAGADYLRRIRPSLERIAEASLSLSTNPGGGELNLAILPTFGTRWLAPRLGEFASRHPGITVSLHTRIRPFDLEEEGMDAAIHFGAPNWVGADHLELMSENVLAICSPAFLERHPISSLEDLLRAPLLQLNSRPSAWTEWFRTHGVAAAPAAGMRFDQFGTMAQAAIHGVGVALMPEFVISKECQDGKLVPVVDGAMKSIGSYFLVWRRENAMYPPLVSFRNWLDELRC